MNTWRPPSTRFPPRERMFPRERQRLTDTCAYPRFPQVAGPGWPAPSLAQSFREGTECQAISKIPCWGGRDRERILLLTRPKSEGTQTHGKDRPELVRTLLSATPTCVWSEAAGDRRGIARQYEPVRLGSWVSDFRLILNGGEPYAEVKPVNDFPLDVVQGVLSAAARATSSCYAGSGATPGDTGTTDEPRYLTSTTFAGLEMLHIWHGGAGLMIDRLVALLRQRRIGRMEGKTQQTATVMAGMTERSGRKWQCGPSDRTTTLQENRFCHSNYNETTVPFPTWEYRPGVQVSTITWHCLPAAAMAAPIPSRR